MGELKCHYVNTMAVQSEVAETREQVQAKVEKGKWVLVEGLSHRRRAREISRRTQ